MQHMKARQCDNNPNHTHPGSWHYTTACNSGTHALGYCSRIKACPDCNANGQTIGWTHEAPENPKCKTCRDINWITKTADEECHHKTAEEAEACYKKYLLDKRTRFMHDIENPPSKDKCKVTDCSEYTSGGAFVGGYQHVSLCAVHRNVETLAAFVNVGGDCWES